MRDVLFIVYYLPPMGSSGVQRPLKFLKYLPTFGWNPVVLAPEPGAYHTYDASLLQEFEALTPETYRVNARTPFHTASNLVSMLDKLPDKIKKGLRSLTSIFMLPDNKKGWIEPALQQARDIIKEKNIQAIFSTAPPYSNHLIAARLKDEFDIPVVMDFRDDWLNSHLIHYATAFHRNRMARMEKQCLTRADVVLAINEAMLNSLESRTSLKNQTTFEVLPQGFDPDDFEKNNTASIQTEPDSLNLLYSGIFYHENQPDHFLKAVRRVMDRHPEITGKMKLHFQGGLDNRHQSLIEELGLKDDVKDYGYQPHLIAVENLKKADVLWMQANFRKNNEQVTTSKLYEYVGSRKPILGLVYKGEAQRLLQQYNASFIAPPDDCGQIEETLWTMFKKWKNDEMPEPDQEIISLYNRKYLTSRLSELFDNLVIIK